MNNEQAYNDYLTAWLNGIEYEINFWDNFIQTKGKDFNITEEKWKNYIAYEKPFTLNDDLFLEETNFLDVGSGPFSSCGTKTEKTKLTFTAVDPLAFIYEKLREKYSIYIYIYNLKQQWSKTYQVFLEKTASTLFTCQILWITVLTQF